MTDESFDIEEPREPVEVSEGVPWGPIAVSIWALALVIFSVQNADHTTVNFLWWSFDIATALLVIVTALVTLILTGIGFAFYRRKRRKARRLAREAE